VRLAFEKLFEARAVSSTGNGGLVDTSQRVGSQSGHRSELQRAATTTTLTTNHPPTVFSLRDDHFSRNHAEGAASIAVSPRHAPAPLPRSHPPTLLRFYTLQSLYTLDPFSSPSPSPFASPEKLCDRENVESIWSPRLPISPDVFGGTSAHRRSVSAATAAHGPGSPAIAAILGGWMPQFSVQSWALNAK
jgi:hypothetical protein